MTSNVKIYYFWIYYIIIFERLTWNKWIYFFSRYLYYSVALSNTQINISSTSLHVLTSRVENFKLILDLNLLTWLEYSSQIFWLNSNTQVKNSDLNRVLTSRVLDLNSSIWFDAISLCIKIAVHLLVIERKSHCWINSCKYRCRINIHLSYKLKEHFSNVLSFWSLDSELIDQWEHRLDDISLWSRWIKTHSRTQAVWSSNEACLLLNSNEVHRFVWLLHAVLSYYFSVFSSEFLIS